MNGNPPTLPASKRPTSTLTLTAIGQKQIHTKPNKERKRTHLHVGSGLPFGGRPHAILRSRQKVHARRGRRGSFTLLELDDQVLPVLLLAFGGGVEEVVGEVELFTGRGTQPDRFVGFNGRVGLGQRSWGDEQSWFMFSWVYRRPPSGTSNFTEPSADGTSW